MKTESLYKATLTDHYAGGKGKTLLSYKDLLAAYDFSVSCFCIQNLMGQQ